MQLCICYITGGITIQAGRVAPTRLYRAVLSLSLALGQSQPTGGAPPRPFVGELSRVDMYNRVLAASDVLAMTTACRDGTDEAGELKSWVEYKGAGGGAAGAVVREPSICGSSDCPPGFRGTHCEIRIGGSPTLTLNYLP